MIQINHKILGELKFNLFWERDVEIIMFGKKSKIKLSIDGDESADFEKEQTDAYIKFFDQLSDLLEDASNEIFKYYQKICFEYRERLGVKYADELVPIITNKSQIADLVKPKTLYIPWAFEKGLRTVGLLFDCSWEPEHGLAVKFDNEKVSKVGYQDIVL